MGRRITRQDFLNMSPEERANVPDDVLMGLRSQPDDPRPKPAAPVDTGPDPVKVKEEGKAGVDLSGLSDEQLIKLRGLPSEEREAFFRGEKPSFDYLGAIGDVGKFVAEQFIPGLAPPLEERPARALGALQSGFGIVESVTGAPTRAAFHAAQKGQPVAEAFGEQFGADPAFAPTGKQIATTAGVSDEPAFKLPVIGEVSPAGAAGLGLEMVLDPSVFIGAGTAKGMRKAADKIAKAVPLKKGAKRFIEKARKLGLEPTKGQLYDSQLVQKLESSLAQQPGRIPGMGLRKTIKRNIATLEKQKDEIIAKGLGLSDFDAGSQVKKEIADSVMKKIGAAEELYDSFDQQFADAVADITPLKNKLDDLAEQFSGTPAEATVKKWRDTVFVKKTRPLSRDLPRAAAQREFTKTFNEVMDLVDYDTYTRLDDALMDKFGSLGGKASNYVTQLETLKEVTDNPALLDKIDEVIPKIKDITTRAKRAQIQTIEQKINTVSNLKRYRSALGKLLSDPNPDTRIIANALYDAASEARSASLKRAAVEAGMEPSVAKGIISQADKIYAEAAHDVAALLGRGKKVKGGVKRALFDYQKKVSNESIINRLIKANDYETALKVKEAFPEAFEVMAAGKIDSLAQAATVKGKVVPNRLFKEIDKLEPNVRRLVFGDDVAEKAGLLKGFIDEVPEKFNPSETSHALALMRVLDPRAFVQALRLKIATGAPTGLRAIGEFALPAAATQQVGKSILPEENQTFKIPGGP